MQELDQMLTTVDIAEMMGMLHKTVLRKIEGRENKGVHVKGIIDILNEHHLEPVKYFIKSSYVDSKGESRPCYKVTRKGCEFLANKFQGEKGIIFTAKYIERFHQMQEIIESRMPADPEKEPPAQEPAPALPEIPKFHGNHIDHKEKAALFVRQYIEEHGDSSGVYRAYKNNQTGNCDVILPYSFFRRVQIKVEEMLHNQLIKQIEAQ